MTKARCICLMLALVVTVAAPLVAHAEKAPGEVREAPERMMPSLAKATCTADCGIYPLVEVRCEGTCVSYDRNCPYQQGYVQCNGGQKIYCAEPCTCFAESFCPEGGSVYCTGTNGDCMGGNGLCFVECDGQIEFCPGYEGQLECETTDPW